MAKRAELEGLKFGRLTVLEYAYTKKSRAYWLCQCECGNKKIVATSNLRTGRTKSCGCFQQESAIKSITKHNKRYTRVYAIWISMKQRCFNPKATGYKYYGGRGIKVCQEWLDDFMNFYNWAMANGYKEGLTIDRINANGDYCSENCRWATIKEQSRNRRDNINIVYLGKLYCLNDLAEILNISTYKARKMLCRK